MVRKVYKTLFSIASVLCEEIAVITIDMSHCISLISLTTR